MKFGPVLILALAGALLAVYGVAATRGSAQSNEVIQLISMDANPAGNAATSLGNLDPCARVEPGATATVDLVVDAVPVERPIIGFEVDIKYNPDVLQATAVDNEFLLAAVGTFQPFEGLEDTLPDTDGDLRISIADLASNSSPGANTESGKGVLSRITFTAKAPGIADIAPDFNPPDVYPALIDKNNQVIEVRSLGGIKIAVGQDCPGGPPQVEPTTIPPLASLEPTPTLAPGETVAPTPGPGSSEPPVSGSPVSGATGTPRASATPVEVGGTGNDDGGTSTGTVIAVAALVALGSLFAGVGGLMLYRRRAKGAEAQGPDV